MKGKSRRDRRNGYKQKKGEGTRKYGELAKFQGSRGREGGGGRISRGADDRGSTIGDDEVPASTREPSGLHSRREIGIVAEIYRGAQRLLRASSVCMRDSESSPCFASSGTPANITECRGESVYPRLQLSSSRLDERREGI